MGNILAGMAFNWFFDQAFESHVTAVILIVVFNMDIYRQARAFDGENNEEEYK